MKPILLKISGLNSYIDEQQIDFEQFRAYGTFGIFGPTGAGKSTILDAMTIALYGPKAMSRGTSDFINAACDKARVFLKFEGGQGAYAGLYTIERGFKRKRGAEGKSDGILTDSLRLHQIDREGNEQIWERQSEVQAQIIGCLGMDHDDFLRSVILPQGKFSEFLALKGKERRDMLERLMGLEAYGDQLRNKVTRVKLVLEKEHEYLKGQLDQLSVYTDEEHKLILEDSKRLEEECNLKKQMVESQKESMRLIEVKREATLKLELAEAEQKQVEAESLEIDKMQSKIEAIKKIQPMVSVEESITTLEASLNDRYRAWIQAINKVLPDQHESLESYMYALKKRNEALHNQVLAMEQLTLNQEKVVDDWMLPSAISPLLMALNESVSDYQSNHKEFTQLQSDLEKATLKQQQNFDERRRLSCANQELLHQGHHFSTLFNEQINQLDMDIVSSEGHLDTLQREKSAKWLQSHLHTCEACPVCHRPMTPDERIQIEKAEHHGDIEADVEKQIQEIRQFIEGKRVEKMRIFQMKLSADFAIKNLIEEMEKEEIESGQSIAQNENALPSFEDWLKHAEKWLEQWKKITNDNKQLISVIETQTQGMTGRQQSMTSLKNDIQEKLGVIEEQLGDRLEAIEKPLTYKALKPWLENHDVHLQRLKATLQEARENKAKALDENHLFNQQYQSLETEGLMIQQGKSDLAALLEKRSIYVQSYFNGELSGYLEILQETHKLESFESKVQAHQLRKMQLKSLLESLSNTLGTERVSAEQLSQAQEQLLHHEKGLQDLLQRIAVLHSRAKQWKLGLEEKKKINSEMQQLEHRLNHVVDIATLLRGNRFIDFIAAKSLRVMTKEASERLNAMTGGRYALETALDGSFVIRDFYHGGELREASSLSGGETFVTSLALALALSSHFQSKGKTKLDFFVLDEGFGSLDKALLETVMNALDHLKHQNLLIGIVSHVEEIKQRIPVRLDVFPAVKGVKGSEIKVVWL